MGSALDQRIARTIAEITGPGGMFAIERDAAGRAIVAGLPATLPAFFAESCRTHADAEAVVMGTHRITFGDLDRISARAARVLAGEYGIRKGDRVAIAMRNAPAWVVAYMAVLRAGAIATLVNAWWQADELGHGLRITEPSLIIADAERSRRIAESDCDVPIVTVDIEAALEDGLAPLLAGRQAGIPAIGPDDDATILFTSGSTGTAKGAVSTHRAVTTAICTFLAYTVSILRALTDEAAAAPLRPSTLIAVPFFHVTGSVPLMLNSFAIGRKMVLMRKWDPQEALRLIEAEKVTYFIGVPTMSLEMMQHPDRGRRDLASLTDICAGGAPRPVAHVARLAEAFPKGHPMIGYGLTETNATGCTNLRGNYIAKPASTGAPQEPFVELAILSDDGTHLGTGETGEIAIRTAANARGYWRNDAATAQAFTPDGFFRTGDLGYRDADGYLFVVDRAKDIIIRGGENISCQEVEAAIYAHPAVAEASVFGLADERLGEVAAAVIHPRPGETLGHESLTAFLRPRLAAFKIPHRIWLSAARLPRLGTGKIDKVRLKRDYGANRA